MAVQYAVNVTDLPTRVQFRRWVKTALSRDARVTLRLVDAAEGRALNKQFRGKDYATNVLTFVGDEAGVLYGDIVFCAPVIAHEAVVQHKALVAHYAHLAIHAILHLQGYDHENDEDAHKMETYEAALLAKLGYANPYQQAEILNE